MATTHKPLRPLLALLVAGAMVVSGCVAQRAPATVSRPATTPTQTGAAPAQPAATPAQAQTGLPPQFTGKLELKPTSGPPGTVVAVTGTGLAANTEFQVLWNTAKGSWVLKGQYNEEFHGRNFQEVAVPKATVRTDAAGTLKGQFTVPEDWGFDHDVTLVEAGSGVVRNKANFSVDMQVSISPTSGPTGTPITVTARGVGYRYMVNSWVLLYDNRITGWLSSVSTNGKATAVIPAAGRPGKHVLQVIHGWSSVAYLNMQQSPQADRPSFSLEFTVTDGQAALPPAAHTQGLAPESGAAPPGSGPALWTNPATGPVGMPAQLLGRGLPPGQEVELIWSRMVGSRVTSAGYTEATAPLAQAKVDDKGNLNFNFKVPDDLGGPHRIEARAAGKTLAAGNFTLAPSVFALEPASGPAGTTVKVHLKGVGWTETANIYHLNYDNAYIGFACGFNSQGDVEIFLKATGEPGWHFIDLYPGIYKGKDIAGVQNFRYPQLTAEQDHPGERLPIFRLAFLVTG